MARILIPTTQNHIRQRLLHPLLTRHRSLPPTGLPHLRLDVPGVDEEEGDVLGAGVAGPDTEDWRGGGREGGREGGKVGCGKLQLIICIFGINNAMKIRINK